MEFEDREIGIHLVQRHHKRFEIDHNLRTIRETVRNSGSDIVVFPEMFITGYCLGRDVFKHALENEGPIIEELASLSDEAGKVLIVGFPERSGSIRGQVHNTAGIFLPGEKMSHYRKIHLVDFDPFEEYAYFTPGKEPVMFEYEGMRFGVLICYDIFFPELCKYYALNGADALICISASPNTTRPFFESIMTARAIENTCYFIYSNLVGPDGRMVFWGGGAVIDPRGQVIAKGKYFEDDDIVSSFSRDVIIESRHHRPTLRDTGPELYERIIRTIKGERENPVD